MKTLVAALFIALAGSPVWAEPPVVTDVRASGSDGVWRFDVTLTHPDTGWDHYADGWQILAPDGSVLGTRELAHPHVIEQPFTRSLGGVEIPAEMTTVLVRARCNIDGWSDPISFALPEG